jgi:hypothetical protein
MGMTDNYKNESSFGPGTHELTVLAVKYITGSNTGTQGLNITYCLGQSTDHPVNVTLWQSKMFNRFLTSWIVGLELKPSDLEQACKNGEGDDWILSKIPGRHGVFEFVETEKVNPKNGKHYLEPKSKAEIEFDEWKKAQNGAPSKSNSGFSDGSNPDDYSGSAPDDAPPNY